jgi:hypothetical protein
MVHHILMHETQVFSMSQFYTFVICLKDGILMLGVVDMDDFIIHTHCLLDVTRQFGTEDRLL